MASRGRNKERARWRRARGSRHALRGDDAAVVAANEQAEAGAVRVPYIPEIVKQEIRAQVAEDLKRDVTAEVLEPLRRAARRPRAPRGS